MPQSEQSRFAYDGSDGPDGAIGSAEIHEAKGAVVVEFRGEIDVAARLRVLPVLDTVTGRHDATVVLDLRPTTFFDCSGVSLLVRAHRRVTERGGRLCVVCVRPMTLRMLRVTRLLPTLSPTPTLDAALRQLGATPCSTPTSAQQ
ncbi:STAS domain-containing protein [Actinomycetota bacterium Odt1-20B]